MSLAFESDEPPLGSFGAPELPDPAALYLEKYDFLCRFAQGRFHIPPEEAASLVHDVFLSYLSVAATIHRPHDWLVSAICNACRYYWRRRAREVPLSPEMIARADPATEDSEDRLLKKITIRTVLSRLDPRSRKVLRLRFEDGYKLRELARVLGVTDKRAEKLLYRAIGRLRVLDVAAKANRER